MNKIKFIDSINVLTAAINIYFTDNYLTHKTYKLIKYANFLWIKLPNRHWLNNNLTD